MSKTNNIITKEPFTMEQVLTSLLDWYLNEPNTNLFYQEVETPFINEDDEKFFTFTITDLLKRLEPYVKGHEDYLNKQDKENPVRLFDNDGEEIEEHPDYDATRDQDIPSIS